MNNDDSQTKFKVVIIGDVGCGKTTLMQTLIYGKSSSSISSTFVATQMTFDENVQVMTNSDLSVDHINLFKEWLEVWDTPGDKRFAHLTPFYARDADLLIITTDASKSDISSNTKYLLQRSLEMRRSEHQTVLLVATKWDICTRSKESIFNEFLQFGGPKEAEIIAVSSKTGENLSLLIKKVKELAFNALQTRKLSKTDDIIILKKLRKRKDKCKC